MKHFRLISPPNNRVNPVSISVDEDLKSNLKQMNKSVQHVNNLRDVTIISNSRSSLCCDDNYSTVGDSNISEGRHVSTGRFSAFLERLLEYLHLRSNNNDQIRHELNRRGLHRYSDHSYGMYDSSELSYTGQTRDARTKPSTTFVSPMNSSEFMTTFTQFHVQSI